MSDDLQRSVLPIPDRRHIGLTTYDAKDPDTCFPPTKPLRPPTGAANVVVVLLDDVGFGASSAFGGPCQMPTAERLAEGGLKFDRFHTTALCAPTRAALLSGRNHHTVGMGVITELATSAPGYNAIRPNTCAPLAETLRLNGYSTAQFGKCHEVAGYEASGVGPFDRWPTGSGFEHFFGFIGGETNQWYPALIEGTTPIEQPATPEEGYHFMADLADRTIAWVKQQKALAPDKPFFLYLAPGATHAPHHVPKEWADKYKGRFDQGWDALRQETFAKQKELGVIPADAELTARPEGIPTYDDMPEELKPVLARQMEVYAGFLSYADHHIGRVVDTLTELGILDDTLIYYVIGDNGASAEGTINGTINESYLLNGASDLLTPEVQISTIDDIGTPRSYNHYAVGWAHAMDTPYQWTKQAASHWGGTRNPAIVHWPNGFAARGEIRHQFHHVIDIAPTVLQAARLPEPVLVNGVTQEPYHGVSMSYCFDDPAAAERRETQYFEMIGNRGIYHKGWTAVTLHKTPWLTDQRPSFDVDVWELYDTNTDWTQARDLAAEHPDKLAELQRLFLIEAAKYNVLPLDDRSSLRFNAEIAGRPTLAIGTRQMFYPGMKRLPEGALINIKNKSHTITAAFTVPDDGPPLNGVIIAQGGNFGGWSLYAKDGHLAYTYNYLGLHDYTITSRQPLSPGEHEVAAEFVYDGGGLGKGGDVTLLVDGSKAGSGRAEATQGMLISFDETVDVGSETGTPVVDYGPDNRFTGALTWVRIDVGDDDHSHLISPDEHLRAAMIRQ